MNKNITTSFDDRYELVLQLFSLCNRMQADGDRFYEEITFKQVFLLSYLQSFGEYEPTLQELADAMGCSRQNAKVIATKLHEAGYVVITPDVKDKRKQRIRITDKALELEKKYSAKDARLLEMLFDGVDDNKIKVMKELFEMMGRNLSKVKGE